MPIPIVIPGSSNVLIWENMRSLSDQVAIEDAITTADIKDTSGNILTDGGAMVLTHQANGNYFGDMPITVPIASDTYYFIEYTATRPSGQVGKTTTLVKGSTGANPIPLTDTMSRLDRLYTNILLTIETITGYEGCPKPDYEIEGFAMDWGKYKLQLYSELELIHKQRCDQGHFELSTPSGAARRWW